MSDASIEQKSGGILVALKKYLNENNPPDGINEDLLIKIYEIFEKEQFKTDRNISRDRLLQIFKQIEETKVEEII